MIENHNKNITPELRERLSKIRHLALDMDGTIYLGSTLFPYTLKFLADMKEAGIGYSLLTNNPSRSVADYLKKLEGLGIQADEENMYTTSLAAIDYIKTHYPEAKRLFLLGTPSMIAEFEKAGFISTTDSADDVPDAVIVAFDKTLQYDRLCRAAWWISQGLPYVATNPDRVCPTDQKVVLVDCGSICECIAHATGRRPDITLGKPDPNMLSGILGRFGYEADEVAMVVQDSIVDEKAKLVDGMSYFTLSTVEKYFTDRFYANSVEPVSGLLINDSLRKSGKSLAFRSRVVRYYIILYIAFTDKNTGNIVGRQVFDCTFMQEYRIFYLNIRRIAGKRRGT